MYKSGLCLRFGGCVVNLFILCGQEISMPDQKKSVGYTGIDKHQNYIDSTTTLYHSCTRSLHNEMSLKAHCTI